MRKVKVYSTAFGLKAINSAATTWSELQDDLTTNNVTFNGMNAVENVGNTTLVLKEARLPEGEFVLMLTPQKTKSGSDYKLVRNAVVDIITKHGVPAKDHFNQGKNYTNKSTAELMGLIVLWNEKHSKSATPVVKVEGVATPVIKSLEVAPALKVEMSTPASEKLTAKKMSFVEALRLVLTYGKVNEYDELRFSILDALEELREEEVSSTEGLSEEELSWINKIKNM
jgi:hypothetical protein